MKHINQGESAVDEVASTGLKPEEAGPRAKNRETTTVNKPTLSHFEQTLERDSNLIRSKILEMAELTERALEDSLKAVTDRSHQHAYAVILRDPMIDELEKQVDRLCLEFLVRQQPVSLHLRFVYAAMKINTELERIGDYAESIVRQALKLDPLGVQLPKERIQQIARQSIPMFHAAVQSFLNRDAALARQTMETEEKVDQMRKEIDAEIVKMREQDKIPLNALVPALTVIRRFERVSDQAKNICEEVLYMCTGEYAKHHGTEAVRVLFVDQNNACLSPMAEVIAQNLRLPNFIFTSAGITPKPIDERVVLFLREKGFEIGPHTSRAVSQVPNLEHYNVVIALSPEGKKAFQPRPARTINLDWSVADPSQIPGDISAARQAYEQAFQRIESELKDFTQAIIGNQTR